jgi:hypothetical protein
MLPNFMKYLPLFFLLYIFFPPPVISSQCYKWVDERGTVHFTDNPATIPSQYREKVSESRYGGAKEPAMLSQTTPPRVVVHFKREDNAILLNALLNWKLPVLFHLDTGATNTMITRGDAVSLGIDPDRMPTMKGYIADGSLVEFPTAVLSSLSVGDAEVDNVEVAIGTTRLLGMNFLNKFHMNIDAESGQLTLERRDAVVREEESPEVREEKTHTIAELEHSIAQVAIAIRARETMVAQIASEIKLDEEKRAKVESIIKETNTGTRFEGSDISSDSDTTKKLEKLEGTLEKINRQISLRKDQIEMQRREIEQLKARQYSYQRLIEKLR